MLRLLWIIYMDVLPNTSVSKQMFSIFIAEKWKVLYLDQVGKREVWFAVSEMEMY